MFSNVISIVKSNDQAQIFEKYTKSNKDWLINTDDNCLFCNVSLSDYIKLTARSKINRSALREYTDVWVYYIRSQLSNIDKSKADPWNRTFPALATGFVHSNTSFYKSLIIEDTRQHQVCSVYTTSVAGNGIYCVDTTQMQP